MTTSICISAIQQPWIFIEALENGSVGEFSNRTVQAPPVEPGVIVRLSEFNLTDQANMPLFDHTADAPNQVLAQMMRLSFPAPQGLDGNIPSPK